MTGATAVKGFVPSDRQIAIFDAVDRHSRNIAILAGAGTGKSTTLKHLSARLPKGSRIVYVAFSKKIQDAASKTFPAYVTVKTFHSLGFQAWKKFVGTSVKLDTNKMRGVAETVIPFHDQTKYLGLSIQLVGKAKNEGISSPEEWEQLITHYELDTDGIDVPLLIHYSRECLKESIRQSRTVIDFDDMLYMPYFKKLDLGLWDYILVDEAQDTNRVQLELLRATLARRGRLVLVGDPFQSIYGFRGADHHAMENLISAFECVELPLDITYRCGTEIVRHANRLVPNYFAGPNNPTGEIVRYGSWSPMTFGFRDSDAILCRNNAPLVSLAFKFIANGRGVQIVGRDIGKGLISLIRKMRVSDIDTLIDRLEDHRAKQVQKLTSKPGNHDEAIAALSDKIAAIVAACDSLDWDNRTVPGLCDAIMRLFTPDPVSGILTLSTVHQAKGLEWDHVYILDSELMPSRWARTPEAMQQEQNLQYVAITRAMTRLGYISTDLMV